ncbi:MAG: hypothetical protein GC131_03685 [Alphaproteobacteria bacterium]|nr:hypothetical protein [Alphaproteobacteria bacterium]
MNDRGEKIVSLASAMLQEPEAGSYAANGARYSWKVVACAALVAAASTGIAASWAAEQRRPLTRYEKTELMALIHFAAKAGTEDEALVRDDFLQQFSIDRLDDLAHSQFALARDYLQRRIR